MTTRGLMRHEGGVTGRWDYIPLLSPGQRGPPRFAMRRTSSPSRLDAGCSFVRPLPAQGTAKLTLRLVAVALGREIRLIRHASIATFLISRMSALCE